MRIDRGEGFEVWWLDRPEAANALSRSVVATMLDQVMWLARSAAPQVVVIAGEGRTFCAGADLKERSTMSIEEVRAFLDSLRELFRGIEESSRVFIAAVDGPALGGGMELALACDLRIAGDGASFALPEVGLGIIPGAGGTQRLPRLIGLGRARELVLTSRKLDADEAFRIGLVEQRAASAVAVARELANRLSRQAPLALAAAKRALGEGSGRSLTEGLAIERREYEQTLNSKDRLEGLAAFRERRAPRFVGQ